MDRFFDKEVIYWYNSFLNSFLLQKVKIEHTKMANKVLQDRNIGERVLLVGTVNGVQRTHLVSRGKSQERIVVFACSKYSLEVDTNDWSGVESLSVRKFARLRDR